MKLKTRRNIYLTAGAVFIAINLLVNIDDWHYLKEQLFKNNSFNIGYFLGSQLFFLIGIVLLRWGYKLHKKIRKQTETEIERMINEIGRPDN